MDLTRRDRTTAMDLGETWRKGDKMLDSCAHGAEGNFD